MSIDETQFSWLRFEGSIVALYFENGSLGLKFVTSGVRGISKNFF